MVASYVNSVRKINVFVIFVGCIILSSCTHAELIASPNRLLSLIIKKYSHAQPVILNMKPENQHVSGKVIHKLSANPPPPLTINSSKRFSRSIWGSGPKLPLVPYILPLIPNTPVLPLFPHWLPPPTSSPFILNAGPVSKLARLIGWSKRKIDLQKKLLEMKHKGALTPEKHLRLQNFLWRI